MASKQIICIVVLVVTLLFQVDNINLVEAQLSPTFYARSCPMLLPTVRKVIGSAIAKEDRLGASILHLFFLDCFVFGCDGSILLEDTSTFKGEQNSNQNRNSARIFDVIDNIKLVVEKACFGVVSCADILAIAARDSVQLLGGPTWRVELGRRDSRTASQVAANISIPAPTWSLSQLISSFSAAGFSLREMVALSGAHTIGQARCTNFRTRIYNESNIDPGFATLRQRTCPRTSSSGDENLAPLDVNSPVSFDNNYFKNLIAWKGLLHSDQELFNGGSTDSIVREYSNNPEKFKSDFAAAMIKMGRMRPLTGRDGVIRMKCGRTDQMIHSTPHVFSFVT